MNIIKSILISLIIVMIIQLGITATALENDSKSYYIDGNSLSDNVTGITIPATGDGDTVHYQYTVKPGEVGTATVTVIYVVP